MMTRATALTTWGILFAAMLAPAAFGQAQPRPAVARIVVAEGDGVAFGSGALIDARGEYGLVVTNWHVVRDATGPIEVIFPSGFRSEARRLKLDEDWDLAALVIWRPPAEPIPVTRRAPRPGEPLTICGYGPGQYREATGRCTEYYAPEVGLPHELVELDVEARQGDSGGPILNAQGEIAGVLFGAGQGTTLGSFGGRVSTFLASLTPPPSAPAQTAPAVVQPFEPATQPMIAANQPATPLPAPPATTMLPASPITDAPTTQFAQQPTAPITPATPVAALGANTPEYTAALWFDQAKSIFAVVGLIFVLMQLIRVVT